MTAGRAVFLAAPLCLFAETLKDIFSVRQWQQRCDTVLRRPAFGRFAAFRPHVTVLIRVWTIWSRRNGVSGLVGILHIDM
jgi:hypothetical protein